MNFEISKSIEILRQTPTVLAELLSGLSDDWLKNNEGEDTWSPYDVLGHLIHGEKTDWIPRARIILSNDPNKTFKPFDRFAQMQADQNKTVQELLKEFTERRKENVQHLLDMQLTEEDLNKKGMHPELGECTLKQLPATWTVHDMGHIAQIARVMSKQYRSEVGPWQAYLSILK